MRNSILISILALVPAIPAIGQDCNGNGIPDGEESLIRAGDYDYDADVDVDDFAALAANLAGPGEPLPDPECAAMLLGAFDADTDGDLDLIDFATFQREFGTPWENVLVDHVFDEQIYMNVPQGPFHFGDFEYAAAANAATSFIGDGGILSKVGGVFWDESQEGVLNGGDLTEMTGFELRVWNSTAEFIANPLENVVFDFSVPT